MFRSACFLLIAISSTFAARGASPNAAPGPDAAKSENVKSDVAKGDYVLQPQDLIRVQVFQEDDLNREVRLSQESTVNLPLIGNVDLKGKTARQAEEMIRAAYDRDYLVNPQVNLFVIEYAKRYVNVLGAVGNPGPVIFPPEEGLTLLDAISRAGGFARIANRKQVTLKRTNADGKTEVIPVNADDIMKGRTDEVVPLQPNDTISVPEIIF